MADKAAASVPDLNQNNVNTTAPVANVPVVQAPVNPLDVKDAAVVTSDLLQSIVDTESSSGEANLLEAAPDIDMSLLQDLVPEKSILLIFLKVLFAIFLLTSMVSIVFFSSQLTNKFEFITDRFNIPNVSKQLSDSNFELKMLQTDLNFYRFLQVKAYLDEFSFYGDAFIQNFQIANSQTSTEEDKAIALEEIKNIRTPIREAFIASTALISEDFSIPLIDLSIADNQALISVFENSLTTKLKERASESTKDEKNIGNRIQKNYLYTIEIIGNSELKNILINTDFDVLTDGELYDLIIKMNTLITNDLSVIQKLKSERIKWSDIINEINLRTIAVDSFFNKDFYDEIGGIQYTSYDFDTSAKRISIVGETKRFDTSNFTLITNLLDELNKSKIFHHAEMRSFSKSGSVDEGYTANVKVTLDLKERDGEDISVK